MPHILLTGGTGLIGRSIIAQLLNTNHTITVLTRHPDQIYRHWAKQVKAVTNLEQIASDQTIDGVINLAGAPIADARWTKQRKQLLEDSRIRLTRQLVDWIRSRPSLPTCFISGSAVGWYGDHGDQVLTEVSGFHDEYAHQLCDAWEQAAISAQDLGIRVCIVRTGLVIAPDGGFLQRLLFPFKLGLGGRLGSGRQYMPWVHIDDIADLFIFLYSAQSANGIFNGCAPSPVTNREFTAILAKQLHRPAYLPVPALSLKLMLGEMSQLLLGSQRAIPEKVLKLGFKFKYTELPSALITTLNQHN